MFFFSPVQCMLLCNTSHVFFPYFLHSSLLALSMFGYEASVTFLLSCFWNKLHSRRKLSFKRQDWCSKFVACCTSVHLFIPDAHSTAWVCREQFTRKSTSKFTSNSLFRASPSGYDQSFTGLQMVWCLYINGI